VRQIKGKKMLYADYKFIINENGLTMADVNSDEMIKVEKTGLKEGDTFVLRLGSAGQMMFVKQAKSEVAETHDW
tara:strand:- start:15359 stop:15580 length:222 start_codon:yes stop_codon:yes gene_type:complete